MIVWKIAVWDSILPPPIMLSQIPMVILALLFIKNLKIKSKIKCSNGIRFIFKVIPCQPQI
jgi:hypothetical protein